MTTNSAPQPRPSRPRYIPTWQLEPVFDPGLPQTEQKALVRLRAHSLRLPSEAKSQRVRLAWLVALAVVVLAVSAAHGVVIYAALACAAAGCLLAGYQFSRTWARKAHSPGPDWRAHVIDRHDLDDQSVQLLCATQQAIGRITSSGVYTRGALDDALTEPMLREFEWYEASLLRDVSKLHSQADDTRNGASGAQTDKVADAQCRARDLVYARVSEDVRRLEELADVVQAADAAYRDHAGALRLAELNDEHRNLLARALADRTAAMGVADLADRASTSAAPGSLTDPWRDPEVLAVPPAEQDEAAGEVA